MFVTLSQWDASHTTPEFEVRINVETFAQDLSSQDYARIACNRISRVIDLTKRAKKSGTKTKFSLTKPMTCVVEVDGKTLVDTHKASAFFNEMGYERGFFTFKSITIHRMQDKFAEAIEALELQD
jgi:hypothetical protein